MLLFHKLSEFFQLNKTKKSRRKFTKPTFQFESLEKRELLANITGTNSDDTFVLNFSTRNVVVTRTTDGQAPVSKTYKLNRPLYFKGLSGNDTIEINMTNFNGRETTFTTSSLVGSYSGNVIQERDVASPAGPAGIVSSGDRFLKIKATGWNNNQEVSIIRNSIELLKINGTPTVYNVVGDLIIDPELELLPESPFPVEPSDDPILRPEVQIPVEPISRPLAAIAIKPALLPILQHKPLPVDKEEQAIISKQDAPLPILKDLTIAPEKDLLTAINPKKWGFFETIQNNRKKKDIFGNS